MLRVCETEEVPTSSSGILGVDQRKKQVTLLDPGGTGNNPNGITPQERRVGIAAPKMFAFDGIFGEDDDQVLLTYYYYCGHYLLDAVGSL